MTRKAEFHLYGKTPVMFMPLPDGYVKIAAYHDKFHEDGSYWALNLTVIIWCKKSVKLHF